MTASLTFDGTDLSSYGLTIVKHDEPFALTTPVQQLLERGRGLSSVRPAATFSLEVAIQATSLATLLSYLDSIKTALDSHEDAALKLDTFSDRYWMARCATFRKLRQMGLSWFYSLVFVAHDPLAYDNTATDDDNTVDEDPESIEQPAGGTAPALPVITLTCDDADELVDDFEWGNDGDPLSDDGGDIDWTISVAGSSKAEIDTAQKYAGTRSARLYRDGTNDALAYFTQTALGSGEELDLRLRMDGDATLEIRHGNGTKRIYLRVAADGDIDYYDGSWHDTGTDVTDDTWVRLVIRNVDWDAGTYDIYLDSGSGLVLIYESADMHTSSDEEDEVAFENTAGTSEAWLDNVRTGWYERTIEINNEETGEILTWTGELRDGEDLEIDCYQYTIELDGEDAISGLQDGSEFPHLLPGVYNTVTVSGFSGNCNFTYRDRYL